MSLLNKTVKQIYKSLLLFYRKTVGLFTCYSAKECKDVFVRYMNSKANDIGANTACFCDASGFASRNAKASAKDMLHILVHAAGITQISEIWNKKEYRMHVKGINDRQITISTTCKSDHYDNAKYPILGIKTGTVPDAIYNLMWCTRLRGQILACVSMGASDDNSRWIDAMKILECVDKEDKSLLLEVNSPAVAVCLLPSNPIMFDNIDLELLLDKNSDALIAPASLTKVMSLICASDFIDDYHEKVKIVKSDIVRGSGNNLRRGDVVTVKDLFYDMLLPSSNTAATALSRHIGKKILKSQS